jgi:hypothetical protein
MSRRLAPQRPFPAYAYIGDGFGLPHPRRDPQGHSYGTPEVAPPPLDPERWWESEAYLFGFDLFNHGYYWEAHEEWEGLWNAAGRRGAIAELLKGLIKLAAAGVKARQGQPEGVRRHGERAREHFAKTRDLAGREDFAGFDLEDLLAFAGRLDDAASRWEDRALVPRHPEQRPRRSAPGGQ